MGLECVAGLSQGFSFVKFMKFEDLIRFISIAPSPFLQYFELAKKHLYFIQTMTFTGQSLVYFVELPDKITKRYVVFNRFKDEISFSEQLGSDGQSVYVPILEVEKTNIFPEDFPKD